MVGTFRDEKGRPTRSERPTWEFDDATKQGKAVKGERAFREIAGGAHSYEYDVMYGAIGSDIVHSGPFSLTHTFQGWVVVQRSFSSRWLSRRCARSRWHLAMGDVLGVDSFTEYLGLDLSAELEPLKAASNADPYPNAHEDSQS